MKVLILEDEKAVAGRLCGLVKEVVPGAIIGGVLETVKESVQWLQQDGQADIILSDIQLADGISFQVFEQVPVHTPIIFTTAYDAYALRAFKLNSIDYLMKPVDKEELKAAFDKYLNLKDNSNGPAADFAQLLQQLKEGISYKSRFLIRRGDQFFHISIDEVAYLRAEDKIVFLHTRQGQQYIIEETLEELESMLDMHQFFRLNRSYIAHVQAIRRIHAHFNGRLKIELHPHTADDLFVSRHRAAAFKGWLNR